VKKVVVFIIIMITILSAGAAVTSYGESYSLSVSSSSSSVVRGATFTAYVNIDVPSNVVADIIKVSYDSSVFEVVSVQYRDGSAWGSKYYSLKSGYVNLIISEDDGGVYTTNGNICKITFRALENASLGDKSISVLSSTQLSNNNFDTITGSMLNVSGCNVSIITIPVTSPPTATPTKAPTPTPTSVPTPKPTNTPTPKPGTSQTPTPTPSSTPIISPDQTAIPGVSPEPTNNPEGTPDKINNTPQENNNYTNVPSPTPTPNPLDFVFVDKATGISFYAKAGVLPKSSSAVIEIILDDERESLANLNITYLYKDNDILPNGNVEIKYCIPDTCEFDSCEVYYIGENGKYELIKSKVTEGYIVFSSDKTGHFTIVEKESFFDLNKSVIMATTVAIPIVWGAIGFIVLNQKKNKRNNEKMFVSIKK